jgi:hypothetical protein
MYLSLGLVESAHLVLWILRTSHTENIYTHVVSCSLQCILIFVIWSNLSLLATLGGRHFMDEKTGERLGGCQSHMALSSAAG